MFGRLKKWWTRRAFQNAALLAAGRYVHELLTAAELPQSCKAIRIIKNTGRGQEFREDIIRLVLQIVQSDEPLRELRKALMSNVKSDLSNRLLFTEEIYPRRHSIYEYMNREVSNPSLLWTDESVSGVAVWSEAESMCLRYLQGAMFEPISEDDWWTAYVKLYEQNTLNLYRSILARADGEELSILPLLLKAGDAALRDFEAKIERGAEVAARKDRV